MKIECTFDTKIFHNPMNKYCIFRMKTEDTTVPNEARGNRTYPDHLIRFTAVGYELPMTNAVKLVLEGDWEETKYGMQFLVEQWREIIPETESGIYNYLSSGLLKGIGARTAAEIVATFGVNTLNVIEKHPEKLLRIRGITKEKLEDMMKLAAEDELKYSRVKIGSYGSNEKGYKYGLYLRSKVFDDILKVAIFYPEHMRSGGRLPVFEVYVDSQNHDFITYNHLKKKWMTSKLNMIEWPKYVFYSEGKWISPRDGKLIQSYLDVEHTGYRGVLDFQMQVRLEELKRRHKKETDPWDLAMEQTPDLPKDWDNWVSKVGIPENFIFYKYVRGGATTGYCTYCEKEVPIRSPKHNKLGTCPVCRHKIQYKSEGKAGTVITPTVNMLTGHGVFSMAELRSRCEIQLENYCKTVTIEANTMVDMAKKQILPAVQSYTAELAGGVAAKKAAAPGVVCSYETGLITKLSALTDQIATQTEALETAVLGLNGAADVQEESVSIRDTILPQMAQLRALADEAETLTAEKYWPFPTYGELLFGVR